MTAETINPRNTPTSEAVRQALEFLRNLAEQKTDHDDAGKTDRDSMLNSDIFKTIEAALKSVAETKTNAKAKPAPVEDDGNEEEEAECADNEDEEEEEDDNSEENNPFAGTYYWNPGPEWKTIGLVAGGAALVGLGALLYKLFDD